jgi:hypothetical protein
MYSPTLTSTPAGADRFMRLPAHHRHGPQEKGDGQLEFGGWIWRYDLAPLGPSETEVTLTDDWSAVPQFIRARGIQFPPFGPERPGRACRTDVPGLDARRLDPWRAVAG